MHRFILLGFLLFSSCLYATEESQADLESLPEVSEPPASVQNGETTEPEITIVRQGKKTVQEFRRSGRLYMIKVIPDVGAPYYFLDTNGDGKLDVRSSDLDQGSRVNMWKLLEWN